MDIKQQQIDNARSELGSFNDAAQTLEQCVQDMRLQYERLEKNMVEANHEIAITNNLVNEQRVAIDRQRKEIDELKEELG